MRFGSMWSIIFRRLGSERRNKCREGGTVCAENLYPEVIGKYKKGSLGRLPFLYHIGIKPRSSAMMDLLREY